jgi:pimeloyl-ACP methyl ester carboxylesterase
MLIARERTTGKERPDFPPAGAEPYKRDVKTLEYHLIDAGHFALETDGDAIAKLMREFLDRHVPALGVRSQIVSQEERR